MSLVMQANKAISIAFSFPIMEKVEVFDLNTGEEKTIDQDTGRTGFIFQYRNPSDKGYQDHGMIAPCFTGGSKDNITQNTKETDFDAALREAREEFIRTPDGQAKPESDYTEKDQKIKELLENALKRSFTPVHTDLINYKHWNVQSSDTVYHCELLPEEAKELESYLGENGFLGEQFDKNGEVGGFIFAETSYLYKRQAQAQIANAPLWGQMKSLISQGFSKLFNAAQKYRGHATNLMSMQAEEHALKKILHQNLIKSELGVILTQYHGEKIPVISVDVFFYGCYAITRKGFNIVSKDSQGHVQLTRIAHNPNGFLDVALNKDGTPDTYTPDLDDPDSTPFRYNSAAFWHNYQKVGTTEDGQDIVTRKINPDASRQDYLIPISFDKDIYVEWNGEEIFVPSGQNLLFRGQQDGSYHLELCDNDAARFMVPGKKFEFPKQKARPAPSKQLVHL